MSEQEEKMFQEEEREKTWGEWLNWIPNLIPYMHINQRWFKAF